MSARRRRAVVVGGGIVGAAVAERLGALEPELEVLVLEKEHGLALHQTGRNSGVVHSGLYYRPGSLKARTCRAGKRLLEELCAREGLPHERCGKVVVAVEPRELAALDELERRGRANGVDLERVGPERLAELEPAAAGVAALWVRESGIVDYGRVVEHLAGRVRERGGSVRTGARALRLEDRANAVRVHLLGGEVVEADLAVNCAGLHCDRLARASGAGRPERIVPFRGEYYELTASARGLVRNLIYPVPDARFPFLGVHFTRLVGGGVECGPNAVLALAREGYRWRDVNLADALESLGFAGFRRLARSHWRTGLGEVWRSLSRRAFVRALQRLVPAVRAEHLVPAPAGVRAQAVAPDGSLVDDFLLERVGRVVHVLNAPSPAATASLAIARHVAALALCRPEEAHP